MVLYKGYRFYYLGLKRWRVSAPDSIYSFDILFKGGIQELMERTDIWKELTERHDTN